MMSVSSVPIFVRNNNRSNSATCCDSNNNNNNKYCKKNDDDITDNDTVLTIDVSACDAVHVVPVLYPYKKEMKQDRRVNTAIGTTAGMAIGGLVSGPLFPIGMVLGASIGGSTTNKLCQFRQKRKQKRWEEKNFQKYINSKQNQVVLTMNEFC